jgi:UDP-N-acetylmuramate dehydrogenase
MLDLRVSGLHFRPAISDTAGVMKNLWQIAQKINMDHGRIHLDEPMSLHTTFRIGGPADLFLEIANLAELNSALCALRDNCLPYFVLGGGANLLVGDKGIRAAVLDLRGFASCLVKNRKLYCDAGVMVNMACEEALARGLGGLENFYGMPGTIGGAIYMNARCYEDDFSRILRTIKVLKLADTSVIDYIDASSLEWGYKQSAFQKGGCQEESIILGAEFALDVPGVSDTASMASTMRSRKLDRIAKGHYSFPSAGSMFKNNRKFGRPTGVIIDSLGLRGTRIGDAAISSYHANIFINLGKASAADMVSLIELTKKRVKSKYGFDLEMEVHMAGEF